MRRSLFFNKVAVLRPRPWLKKKLWYRVFSCEFCNILRRLFLTEHLGWLLLNVHWNWILLSLYNYKEKATSKTGPGPRKIYTLKNLDTEKARPEKAGPYETWTLKNIVQFINTEWETCKQAIWKYSYWWFLGRQKMCLRIKMNSKATNE